MFALSLLSGLLLCAAVLAENSTLVDPVTGATAVVLGQSGKIDFHLNNKTMQVTISSLTELDASGNAVGTTGSADEKHTFNSFASKDFVFSEVFTQDFQGLSTSRVNFTCELFGGETHLQVQLILFLEAGSVNVHNTTFDVDSGSFKYTYSIDYWPFCTAGGSGSTLCTKAGSDQVGEFLDFEIIIKGDTGSATVNNETIPANGTSVEVEWADGGKMVFPGEYEEVNATGARVWMNFLPGYPLVETKGSKDTMTVRFARFDAAVEYDPFTDPDVAVTTSPTPAATLAPTPAATLAPTPAATLAPTPAATLAPTPAATLAPTPAATLAPTPAATLAPTPAGGTGTVPPSKSSDQGGVKPKHKPKPKPKSKYNQYSQGPTSTPSPSYNSGSKMVELTSADESIAVNRFETNGVLAVLGGMAVACVVAIVAIVRSANKDFEHDPLPDCSENVAAAMNKL